MENKLTKGLSFFLTTIVIIMATVDIFLVVTAPWWLKTLYESSFSDIKIMLGYNYSTTSIIYPLMLIFFFICGLLCLGILIAAFRILYRIRQGVPFCIQNATSLRNAASSAFGLSVIFIAKMFFSPSILTLVCAGIFTLFGLFVLVMSLLIREAARIKEENELTI
jgi:hypothetical protein